ncbi:MAG TPA: DUF2905 domain-containing protein [Acidimicrobiales bacterium]|nr:DUF2905 domain-containing protein [Acidimicrobiales bacterium]
MDFRSLGWLVILVGLVIVLVGLLFVIGHRFGWSHLPGDIVIHRGNTTVYIPLATMIIISVVLTVVVNLLRR